MQHFRELMINPSIMVHGMKKLYLYSLRCEMIHRQTSLGAESPMTGC